MELYVFNYMLQIRGLYYDLRMRNLEINYESYFCVYFRETQGRDLTTARSQIMELESEVERVKRQLTNERFER